MEVGVRELRDRLSSYLADVRAGRTVTVTDHGVPVARLSPVGQLSALERLRAEGRIEPARKGKRPAPKRVKAKGTVSDLVSDQRR
ncbi:type II toxin-antitoxin system Phd/YefM family antitoxin [Nocardia camponoti]|uniref:Antitoxin n=1 Tax=Nocardia camponoti TaxID=1616106 RepID=A0A917V907_9NOCA|nr:type II toxin-antitoxin system prevent-host-death family antitoxin [Nocardia camponoti]GGK51693.1 hypothetical protein GCM10011591_24250 [Nocardia camponoti]